MHTIWKVTMLATLIALGAIEAQAQAWPTGPVTVEILNERDQPFRQFPTSESSGDIFRAYLRAERGAPYHIRVHNHSGQRIGLVIAVDGRNIVSGERSQLARFEAMYVLEAGADSDYTGWRKNLSSVNEFYFTDWSDSYAEAFGDRSARGVIAVAAFPERGQYRVEPQYEEELGRLSRSKKGNYDAAAQASASPPVAPSENIGGATRAKARAAEPGTGYGERRHDPVRRVEFEAQTQPFAQVFLKYEWPESLCKRGIGCDRSRHERNRFWDEDTYGFAPAPPARGYR